MAPEAKDMSELRWRSRWDWLFERANFSAWLASGVCEVFREDGGSSVEVVVVSGFRIAVWDTHGSKLSDIPLK